MGKRGPQKTPTNVLKIRGSWRAKERQDEARFGGEIGDCPDWMGEHGKSKWKEACAVLVPLGMATSGDRDALIQYCEAWQDFMDALGSIDEHGAEINGSMGSLVANPAVRRKQLARATIAKIGQAFGFAPAWRAGLDVAPRKKQSSKASFFKGGA